LDCFRYQHSDRAEFALGLLALGVFGSLVAEGQERFSQSWMVSWVDCGTLKSHIPTDCHYLHEHWLQRVEI
jgi:hypothetical protein